MNPVALGTWEDAAREAHEAMEAAYPQWFLDNLRRLPAGEGGDVEPAIRYLEHDPWAFRSGYFKTQVLKALRHLPLTAEQEERLRAVVLHVIDDDHRRQEMRDVGRLAAYVETPALRRAVWQRIDAGDRGQAVRAIAVAQPGRTAPDARRSVARASGVRGTAAGDGR